MPPDQIYKQSWVMNLFSLQTLIKTKVMWTKWIQDLFVPCFHSFYNFLQLWANLKHWSTLNFMKIKTFFIIYWEFLRFKWHSKVLNRMPWHWIKVNIFCIVLVVSQYHWLYWWTILGFRCSANLIHYMKLFVFCMKFYTPIVKDIDAAHFRNKHTRIEYPK
jgi:hypothetical protein